MMSLFHLFTFLLLSFNFSATTDIKTTATPVKKTIHPNLETSDFLTWEDERRLTWDDFLCEPKRNTDAVALTNTALGISYKMENGQLNYEITCSFSKTKSWGLLRTPYILAHEQGHFDITEIFARKLHQELSNYVFNKRSFRQDVGEIYKRVVKQKEEMQYAYDGQSDHSRNKNIQREWLNKIDELLEQTAPYANYP